MITENLNTLKINKLTQKQYDNALKVNKINENELYLTPDIDVYDALFETLIALGIAPILIDGDDSVLCDKENAILVNL